MSIEDPIVIFLSSDRYTRRHVLRAGTNGPPPNRTVHLGFFPQGPQGPPEGPPRGCPRSPRAPQGPPRIPKGRPEDPINAPRKPPGSPQGDSKDHQKSRGVTPLDFGTSPGAPRTPQDPQKATQRPPGTSQGALNAPRKPA